MTQAPRGPLLLLGGGKMGGALLAGWIKAGLRPADAWVVEPDAGRRQALQAEHGVHVAADVASLVGLETARTLVVAVKPQMLNAALPACRPLVGPQTLVLSIAAGKTIAAFEAMLGPGTRIVRAMPNTPAAVGRGATALFANALVELDRKAEAEALMAAVGITAWLDSEEQMHAVTAVSGGGPAYVALLIETLAESAVQLGLPADLAMRLARATVVGSGELARQSPSPAAQLRIDVTSPGGTTQAALHVLMAEDGIQPLFDRAMRAAARRSQELG
ncbi:MAG: pyrroline-5-carboxylate reductase [Geminicoccaceae bacterium]